MRRRGMFSMGQDFIRRRSDRFRRLRDENFTRLVEPNLFSETNPRCVTAVPGMVLPQAAVSSGDHLWAETDGAAERIRFFRGDTPVVEVSADAALALGASLESGGGMLIGLVTEVDEQNALATLRLCDATADDDGV